MDMTVVELRKLLEQCGAGREVRVAIELHGNREVGSVTINEEGSIIIHGKHIPAADIRFPG
jgi:hypothetical protein